MNNLPDDGPNVNPPDWIAVASGAALGDTEGQYYDNLEADIVQRAIDSHTCDECCGISYDPFCPMWSDSVHALLRPRRDPRYASAAQRVGYLAARLEHDTAHAEAIAPDLKAMGDSADLLGGTYLRLMRRAWRGATPAERAEFLAEIAPELRAMIRDEVRALLVLEVEGQSNG